jgi:hypothetical protein
MLQDVSVAGSLEVEVCMISQIDNGVFVGGGGVIDLQLICVG